MKLMLRDKDQRSKIKDQGLTSVVVVFVLVTLLTLIGIGFTKIINRSLQSSAANQQASAANYAAESGINDVLSYLKTKPSTSAANCSDLIKPGGPLAKAAKISSDGSTAYTCVLVDPSPTSLFYQSLAAYESQIVKITTSAPLASLLFSWQSPNRQQNQFVPAAQGQPLYDEKTWSDKNYAPLLRLTLYPIPANGDLTNVQTSSKTYFLYPQNGGHNTLAYDASGDLAPLNCASKNIGSFSGSADYDCNAVINNLPPAGYFYARFAPYYDQASVKISGNDSSGQVLQFKNVQSVVDVTAKSGGATKRLQARVDTSAASGGTDLNISASANNAPQYALRSALTICKRLIVPDPGSIVLIDPLSATTCTQGTQIIAQQQKPTITTTDATNKQATTATLNGTVNPNGASVLTCKFNYGTSQSYGSSQPCPSLPGAGNSPVAVSANISGLSANTLYHFQLCATNVANSKDGSMSCGTDLTFTTPVPAPTVTGVAVSNTTYNESFFVGYINPNGAATTFRFEYGTSTSYGKTADSSPGSPLPAGSSSLKVTGDTGTSLVSGGTQYYFQLCATSSGGTACGQGSFATPAAPGGGGGGSPPSGEPPPSSGSPPSGNILEPKCNIYGVHNNGNGTGDVWGDCSNAVSTEYWARFSYSDPYGHSCSSGSGYWQGSSTFGFQTKIHNVIMYGRVRGHNSAGYSYSGTTSKAWINPPPSNLPCGPSI